jgi:hypothetical protein
MREYSSKFLGTFHFQHGIFNFSYLFIYLIYLFGMGYICVCVLKMYLGEYYGTQTLFVFFPFKFFLKKRETPFSEARLLPQNLT